MMSRWLRRLFCPTEDDDPEGHRRAIEVRLRLLNEQLAVIEQEHTNAELRHLLDSIRNPHKKGTAE